MDIIRPEVLEEMIRNGRAYRHEIQSIAFELKERRAGRDPTPPYDGLTILVPRAKLLNASLPSAAFRNLGIGESQVARWDSGIRYQYYVIHRLPDRD